MKRVFEFRCPQGHKHSSYQEYENRESECPECGEIGSRIISQTHIPIRSGVDPSLPTMAAKWERMQRLKASGKMKDGNNHRYGGRFT